MSTKGAIVVACPQCRGRRIGRISANLYFCGDCCLELAIQPARRTIDLFQVDEEGNQIAVGRRRFEELSHPPQPIHS